MEYLLMWSPSQVNGPKVSIAHVSTCVSRPPLHYYTVIVCPKYLFLGFYLHEFVRLYYSASVTHVYVHTCTFLTRFRLIHVLHSCSTHCSQGHWPPPTCSMMRTPPRVSGERRCVRVQAHQKHSLSLSEGEPVER